MDGILNYFLSSVSSFDHNVLKAVNSTMRCGILDSIMPYITKLGDAGIFWIALALILLIPKKTRRTGAAMGVAMVIGLIVGNGIIKPLVARPRPFNISNTILPKDQLLISAPTDYSFPSGHTLASFEAATALYKDHTLYGFAAFVLAILIAFSRISGALPQRRFRRSHPRFPVRSARKHDRSRGLRQMGGTQGKERSSRCCRSGKILGRILRGGASISLTFADIHFSEER